MKSSSLRIWAVSAVAAVAAVGVAYGLVSDSVLSPGNQAHSGEHEPAPVEIDVELAQAIGGECDVGGLSWQDASIGAIFDEAIEAATGDHDYFSDNVCVRLNPDNSTVTNAAGFVSMENVLDTEDACSPGEAEAGDSTCGSGVGELSGALYWNPYVAAADCTSFTPVGGALQIAVAEGAVFGPVFGISTTVGCLQFRVSTHMNSSDSLLDLAQSDSVSWAWRVHASE
jgi:hypothetical protein